MRTFTKSADFLAIGFLISLPLASACSSGMKPAGQTGVPAPRSVAGTAPQPVVPRQFAEVAEANWTPDMPLVGREIECQGGKARIFPCQGINLLAFLPESAVGGPTLTGIWGWTDPETGREFVIAAREGGTSFVEITDPLNPRYLGELPVHAGAQPSRWRDVKVYKNHAFIVSDNAGSHGMQVFDLTQLRTVKTAPAVFQETAHYGRIASAHTVAIDTATGFAYVVGSNGEGETCGGGLHMIDIHNPSAPVFVGCYAETLGGSKQDGYIHETECVVYHGPDQRYHGREICLNAAVAALGIVDVTDKQQPKPISVGSYPNVGYTHQGWLTDDQRYFVLNDELDEMSGVTPTTRTIIFDLKSLSDPVVAKEFFGTTVATDHNLYIRGRYVYQSNYRAGLRVLDIADPVNPSEIGYFDTTPAEEITPAMGGGSWGNYPYFRNGVIAVSTYGLHDVSIGKGLFILRHPAVAAVAH